MLGVYSKFAIPFGYPEGLLLQVCHLVQLIPWAEYSLAKRNGTLNAMLEALQQSTSINVGGKAKRPLEAVANSGVNAVTTQATAGKQQQAKKLKTMLPGCRMM